jgi:twitching motility protein PilI
MQNHANPFEILHELAGQCSEANSYRLTNNDLNKAWSGIGFSLCGKAMMAPMGEVSEVTRLPKYTMIPGVKSWVIGVSNLRGRLLPIIDLEAFVGSRLASDHNQHRVLVVEIGDIYVGLLVSRVFGLKHFSAVDIDANYRCSNELYANYIDGIGSEEGSKWMRFSTSTLIKDAAFSDIACSQRASTEVFARTVA